MAWAMRGLSDGVLTTGWPRVADEYADGMAAGVVASAAPDRSVSGPVARAVQACPTAALRIADGGVRVDRGRCVLCGRCVALAPEAFGWLRGPAGAVLDRPALVTEPQPESTAALAQVRDRLHRKVRRMGRSVHLRHVDTGSDGSDEWEVQALFNPVYDAHRLGIFLTASPRHADILLLTGIGAAGMVAPLLRTRAAMPEPVVVIVAGADAISGGLFAGSYARSARPAAGLDVDVWIPGSPATPFALLYGILLALGRLRNAAVPG